MCRHLPTIVFGGGIHGVGKSTFSTALAQGLSLAHANAGELIARQEDRTPKPDKQVDDVLANQHALVAAIAALPPLNGPLLLDGHFCVLDRTGHACAVPIETFRLLSPIAALLLRDDVRQIQERLVTRDHKVYPAELLHRLQEAEIAHANLVCSTLHVPIRVLSPSERESAVSFIKSKLPV
jgi:adenylate kinase